MISMNLSYSSSARDKSGGAEKFKRFHCDRNDGFADERLSRVLDENGGQPAVLRQAGDHPAAIQLICSALMPDTRYSSTLGT